MTAGCIRPHRVLTLYRPRFPLVALADQRSDLGFQLPGVFSALSVSVLALKLETRRSHFWSRENFKSFHRQTFANVFNNALTVGEAPDWLYFIFFGLNLHFIKVV